MFHFKYQLGQCTPKDSNECLRDMNNWKGYSCYESGWCTTWEKDFKRCCPISCGVEKFTEDECNKSSERGTCIYPNKAQCPENGKFITLLNRQKRYMHIK